MLIGYVRISQEGIEPLKDAVPPVKDTNSSHTFFDDFRISLQYKYNEQDNTSGVGVLIFAPNGLLWTQTSIYAHGLDEFAGYYLALDQTLEEAIKTKSKNIIILVKNKDFVHYAAMESPYKLKEHNDVHNLVIDKLKKFNSYKFIYRKSYPKSVQERLDKEANEAAEGPKFDSRGYWTNQPSKPYFNVIPDVVDEKMFAEQMAHLWVDHIKSYFKEFEEDYGKEAYLKLRADIDSGKLKELPDVKRVKENKQRYVPVKNFPAYTKVVICQHCENAMRFERCVKKYPEKELRYFFRCSACQATKEINEKGRIIVYGKYSKKLAN